MFTLCETKINIVCITFFLVLKISLEIGACMMGLHKERVSELISKNEVILTLRQRGIKVARNH